MIPGWTSKPVDGRLLDARLPEPHVARYRDIGPDFVPAAGVGSMVVRQMDGNEAVLAAGASAARPAIEVRIIRREVFHAILVDRTEVDLRWQGCGAAPATQWEAC